MIRAWTALRTLVAAKAEFLTATAAYAIFSVQAILSCAWLWRHVWKVPSTDVWLNESAGLYRGTSAVWMLLGAGIICWLMAFVVRSRSVQILLSDSRIKAWLSVEAIITWGMASAWFKTMVYPSRPEMALSAWGVMILVAVLHKFAAFKVVDTLASVWRLLTDARNGAVIRQTGFASAIVLIAAIVYVPHQEAALARMFIGEQLHHFDIFIGAPGWAVTKGQTLYIDTISQYGMGLPMFLSGTARLLGGFTYLHAFQVIMWIAILYYIALFVFLRKWTGSLTWSTAGILLAIRTQMFHPGLYPFAFTYPSATAVRHCFDIMLFVFLWKHIQTENRRWLWGAALCCGWSMFYVESTGLFMTAAFYAYLGMYVITPYLRSALVASRRDWIIVLGWMVTPFAFAGLLFWIVLGSHLWTARFWHNLGEYVAYFIAGAGTIPMTESLKTKDFLACLMGFVIPLVYVFTMIFTAAMVYLKKAERMHGLAFVISVYGLGVYHYYVARSAITNYYVVGVPFAILCAYWAVMLTARLSPSARRQWGAAAVLISMYALFSNHMFIMYPNALNWSRNPITDRRVAQPLAHNGKPYFNHLFYGYPDAFKMPKNSLGETEEYLLTEGQFASDDDLVAFFRREFDFTEDAKLIQSLTPSESEVPVISSFETRILMQADRKPFFYYMPLVNSRPIRMRIFVVGFFHSPAYLENTLKQLEAEKPEYIFLERIFLNRRVPQAYYYDSPNVMAILDYVHTHYQTHKEGRFLAAMRRRGR